METRPQIIVADWWSRIISFVSLAVAVGAVYYVYSNPKQAEQAPQELVTSFESKLDDQVTSYREDFQKKQQELEAKYHESLQTHDDWLTQEWNKQLGQALANFQQDAQELLSRMENAESTASQQREVAFRQELDLLRSTAADGTGVPNETDAVSDAADSLPLLQLATTSLRPGTNDGTLIRVENEGTKDALIKRIRFKPEADFQLDSTEQQNSVFKTTEDVVTITFNSSDNTSSKPGMHGVYDRTIGTPIRVPAGESVTVRVLIEDPDHLGWGFTGKMVIDYEGRSPLTIETARVPFEAPIPAEVSPADLSLDFESAG